MESKCNSKQQWSEQGAIISGHKFVEIEQPDKTKQVLKCEVCGYESVGILTSLASLTEQEK